MTHHQTFAGGFNCRAVNVEQRSIMPQETASGLFVLASVFTICGTRRSIVSCLRFTSMTSAAGPFAFAPSKSAPRSSCSLQEAYVGCRAPRALLHDCSPCAPLIQTLSLCRVRVHGTARRIIRSSLSTPPFSEARILTIELPAATALTYFLLFR